MKSDYLREKLDHLIKNDPLEDYNSISALIGKNHSYIQQFIKRGIPKNLHHNDLIAIANHFGVSVEYLNGRTGFSEAPYNFQAKKNILFIPYYDIGVSAGAGSIIDGEDPISTIPFSVEKIHSLGVAKANLAILKVRGDSMFPTLNDGDDILIDTSCTLASKDGIYVLRLDDGLMVKRISINPTNKLITVKSDNALYQTWENCPPESLHLIGRVVWTGRNL